MIDYHKDVSNLEVELIPGMVRVALFANGDDPFIPDDYTTDALLALDHVEEVGACGAQDYHVILRFDSIAEMFEKMHAVQIEISATLVGCQVVKLKRLEDAAIEEIKEMWEDHQMHAYTNKEINGHIQTICTRYDLTVDEWHKLCEMAREQEGI